MSYDSDTRPELGDSVTSRLDGTAMVVAEVLRDDAERCILRCTWDPGGDKAFNETDLSFVSRAE